MTVKCLARVTALVMFGVCILAAGSAQAATILFTNRALWEASASGLTNIDFEENAPGGFTSYPTPPGATKSGVNFTIDHSGQTVDGNLFTVDPGFGAGFYDWGSGDILSSQVGSPAQNIVATLAGTTALGTDFMTADPQSGLVIFTLSNGFTAALNGLPRPNRAFFGVISDDTLTSLRMDSGGNLLNIDNFAYASDQAAVPEPATLSLLGLGLVGLARRRFSRPRAS